ncbi:class A beta-lactamase-related serine hydrolase [Actinomadura rubrisoli]|uniref:Class A beta-lactamase-related serine hydrolase n=2 Tax=Actinomadura rubrisoli TaxID=2530368 RepID=A0A4R5CB84_9ACTN|nr:class A beta-lactamase-related serine hydrolase [Actinomadura rubrisoli]
MTIVSVGALTTAVAAPSLAGSPPPHARTRAALEAIVEQGTPGVIAEVMTGGRSWTHTAGVADLGDGRPRASGEKFRIASMSKPFTAATLLKLEAAGELSLGDSVEKWLPGVVRGERYRPGKITVRHLLNHTSGIFNYNNDDGFRARYAGDEFDKHRYDTVAPRELVRIALAHPAVFQPGQPGRWEYSDTNYVLAAMIIEKATGHRYEDEVERRLIEPLGLTSTSVPAGSPEVPRPHARHYSTLFEDGPDAKVRDVTEFNPTVAWGAGQVISTTGDVNRFLSLLLRGKVLPPRQQREMFATVPVQGEDGHGGPDDRYGLGIRRFKLKEGCWVWGHGGMIPGSASRTAATGDGRHVLTMNRNGDWGEQELEDAAVQAEFCSGSA